MTLTHSNRLRTSAQEVTQVFDAVDRWDMAKEFGIDRVHEKTRIQIYDCVSRGRPLSAFQDVVGDIAALHPDEHAQSGVFHFMNFDDFTNDVRNADEIDYGVLQTFVNIRRWLRETVAKHCPFVGPSMNHARMWMTVARQREATGIALFSLLEKACHAFKALSPEADRNRILNAFIVVMPDVRGFEALARFDQMISCRQEFGSECDKDVVIGSFMPSVRNTAIVDPYQKVPPLYVFRHSMNIVGKKPF